MTTLTTRTPWAQFDVVAHTVEPVVMTSGDHSRNRASTLPFITGSALRGALAARWLRQEGHYPAPGRRPTRIEDPTLRARFLEVFESGAVRFPFLFLGDEPAVPLSVIGCKRDPRHARFDLASPANRPEEGRQQEKKVCAARPPEGATGTAAAAARCDAPLERVKPDDGAGPARMVRTRTAVSDRGTAARAMLYAQEELTEGQVFCGVLRARPDLADELAEWLPVDTDDQLADARLTVGADRSTSGLVEVTITRRKTPAGPALRERRDAWHAAGRGRGRRELAVTARSPLLLTDAWQRPARRFDPSVLARALGLPADVAQDTPGTRPPVPAVAYAMARTRSVAGWNPAAGLPKPTDTALVEGSVAVLELPDDTDWDALAARLEHVEDEGAGWRRAEGFGDVRFWDDRHLLDDRQDLDQDLDDPHGGAAR